MSQWAVSSQWRHRKLSVFPGSSVNGDICPKLRVVTPDFYTNLRETSGEQTQAK